MEGKDLNRLKVVHAEKKCTNKLFAELQWSINMYSETWRT